MQYRYFFYFVILVFLQALYVFGSTIAAYDSMVKMEAEDENETVSAKHAFKAMRTSPFIMILIIYTFLAILLTGLLFFYHIWITSVGSTTHDKIKRTYGRYKSSPFDLGFMNLNFNQVLGRDYKPYLKPRKLAALYKKKTLV